MKKFLPLLLFAFFTTNFFSQEYTEDSYHGETGDIYTLMTISFFITQMEKVLKITMQFQI